MLKSTPRVSASGAPDQTVVSVRTLFDAEEAPLLRYAFALVGRRAVAEEIVQEVFLQLHQRWDDIESPRAWLFTSVRNRVYNHIRDHRRESAADNEDTTETAPHDGETPDVMFTRLEAIGTLREILAELDEQDRQLIKLKYFEGLSYRDIGTRTGLSIGNVGYRLHHLLKQVAKKLHQRGVDEIS